LRLDCSFANGGLTNLSLNRLRLFLGAGGIQPPAGLEAELNARKGAGVARLLPSRVANRLRSLARGAGQKDTVFVGLASIPSRIESLEKVIKSLLVQADEIGVYLNNYEDVPAFLKHPRIRVARSQKHGDVRDNGKFFFVEKTKATFYATVDDDIAYPDNYIAELVRYQKLLGGTQAVGVHGSVYPRPVKKLLSNRYLFHFSHPTEALTPVDMLGTGTLLFNRRYWGLRYSEILTPGMADVWLAVAAAKRGFGLWSIPRTENWMHALEQDEEGNLFQEGKFDDSVQVAALTEARIGSSRESLLERIVRMPWAGADFAIDSAVALAQAAARLSLPPIDLARLKLYAGAIVAHKREAKSQAVFAAETSEVDYVDQLLKRVAGIRDAEQVNFETAYLAALEGVDEAALPAYQRRDKALLAAKAAAPTA
jgi:hypothetical protein